MGETIEELLKSMLTLRGDSSDFNKSLANTADTWRRIGEQDSFSELNFTSESEKEQFLKDWTANNPYNNL